MAKTSIRVRFGILVAALSTTASAFAVVQPPGSFLAEKCTVQGASTSPQVETVCIGEIELGSGARRNAVQIEYVDGSVSLYAVTFSPGQPGLGQSEKAFWGARFGRVAAVIEIQGKLITTMGIQRTDRIELQVSRGGVSFQGDLEPVMIPMSR